MKTFNTPQWESNAIADKTCSELFRKSKYTTVQKNGNKKNKKTKKPKIKNGGVEKVQFKKQQQKVKHTVQSAFNTESPDKTKFKQKNLHRTNINVIKNDDSVTFKNKAKGNKKQKKKLKAGNTSTFPPNPKTKQQNKNVQQEHFDEDIKDTEPKKQKNITHQTLFIGNSHKKKLKVDKNVSKSKYHVDLKVDGFETKSKKAKQKLKQTSEMYTYEPDINIHTQAVITNNKIASIKQKQFSKFRNKLETHLQHKQFSTTNKNQGGSLRERMMEKLKAARFRYLNEQMYTSMGKDAKKYFENDRNAFSAYHEGYQQQVAKWPLNPVDVIIKKIQKLPQSHVVADFGCGKAQLAKSVPHTVHSFDLVALDECVTPCDMSRVPLDNDSIDAVVFCLSLMGTNLKDYLREANRVLKKGGILLIAEIESRLDNVDNFIKDLRSFGFAEKRKDLSYDLFYFIDFIKRDSVNTKRNKLPDISLNPCLYKKR